ncbi:MAG: hypothetical protein AABO58_25120 [Acidobacteriota bacterium]
MQQADHPIRIGGPLVSNRSIQMNRSTAVLALISFFLVCPRQFAAPAAALRIAVDRQAVTISNIPGGTAMVLFSCSRVPQARSISVKPEAIVLRDDDHDGVIRHAPADGIPLWSVWAAVNPDSGEVATGARAEYPFIVRSAGPDALRKDIEGELAAMAVELPRISLLLVRPGVGAWLTTTFDGKPDDRDGIANGHVKIDFNDTVAVQGKEKGPKHVKKGDTIVAIDPAHLDVFIMRVEN